jgi:hypothetical protein
MRSSPGKSLSNLTQCTMRVPGLTGSLVAAAGSQDSFAILFSSQKPLFFTLLQLR